MSAKPPEIVEIEHDEYHAKHVGWTVDGRQFFLTTPFEPAIGGKPGCEFVALYIFNTDGKLLEAKIDELGPRVLLDKEKAKALYDQRLKDLAQLRQFAR